MAKFFITGTCTGVGKTSYSVDLIRTWRSAGEAGIGLKPFATGDREDAIRLQAAMEGVLSLDEINLCWLTRPMAPLIAAQQEGREIPYASILKQTRSMIDSYSHIVVEGAGGWLVPITEKKRISDFAKELGLPVIVVARAGLGTINQTLLTIDRIDRDGLEIHEIILNLFPSESPEVARLNLEYLRTQCGISVQLKTLF